MGSLFYGDVDGTGDSRIIRNMITSGKQCANDMFSGTQLQFLTGGSVSHMDVLPILADGFAQIGRQISVNNQMMMAFAFIDAFFSWLSVTP